MNYDKREPANVRRMFLAGSLSALVSIAIMLLNALNPPRIVQAVFSFSPGYVFGFIISIVVCRTLEKRFYRVLASTFLGVFGFYVAQMATIYLYFNFNDKVPLATQYWLPFGVGGLLGALIMVAGLGPLLKLRRKKLVIPLALIGGFVGGSAIMGSAVIAESIFGGDFEGPGLVIGILIWQVLVASALGYGLPLATVPQEKEI